MAFCYFSFSGKSRKYDYNEKMFYTKGNIRFKTVVLVTVFIITMILMMIKTLR